MESRTSEEEEDGWPGSLHSRGELGLGMSRLLIRRMVRGAGLDLYLGSGNAGCLRWPRFIRNPGS